MGGQILVAQVRLDNPLPHLDHPFDYLVPDKMLPLAKVGVRVKATLGNKTFDGFIVGLSDSSEIPTKNLVRLKKIVSDQVVLTPEQISLIRAVADHCGGVFADVARFAVAPRHSETEKFSGGAWPQPALSSPKLSTGSLVDYPNAAGFLTALEKGGPARAFWQVVPCATGNNLVGDWVRGFAQAAGKVLASGRSVIVVVPEISQVEQVRAGFAEIFGTGSIAVLHEELGRPVRYRNYLACVRGEAKIVIGTRSAAYAPISNLGLICLFDDQNESLNEKRSPYPRARDVVALRAAADHAGVLFASYSRSVEMQVWLARGWLGLIQHDLPTVRRNAPMIRANADTDFALQVDPAARRLRIPSQAFQTIREGLLSGPVLVQVARPGYLMGLRCDSCREPARCSTCNGWLKVDQQSGHQMITCEWCGATRNSFTCSSCGGARLWAPISGATRTAEELARAFPGFRLIDSSANKVIHRVDDQPALVVATPNAEPDADGGYAGAVILDCLQVLNLRTFRASELAVHRWLKVVSKVRSGKDGGKVCLVGPAEDRAIRTVLRIDPGSLAVTELTERTQAQFPPAFVIASVEGKLEAITQLSHYLKLPEGTQVLGPTVSGRIDAADTLTGFIETMTLTLRAPANSRQELVKALQQARAVKSAAGSVGPLRIQVD